MGSLSPGLSIHPFCIAFLLKILHRLPRLQEQCPNSYCRWVSVTWPLSSLSSFILFFFYCSSSSKNSPALYKMCFLTPVSSPTSSSSTCLLPSLPVKPTAFLGQSPITYPSRLPTLLPLPPPPFCPCSLSRGTVIFCSHSGSLGSKYVYFDPWSLPHQVSNSRY